MLGLSNIGIPGSRFDAARRQGFTDKARQNEEKRGDGDFVRDLATDRFPIQDGVDLLARNFGREYADGYRLGVDQSSQTREGEAEQKTAERSDADSDADSDEEDETNTYKETVGEAFRNNIMLAIDKHCKLLRAQIEQAMTEGMATYAMTRATEKMARIYGYDLVFNINTPVKTRKDIDRKIKAESNEMCKKLRQTRKWNSYHSDSVQETLRQIRNRIVDEGISDYAKEKIADAKAAAEQAVSLTEDKIITQAIQAAKNVADFCREWKQEISRWKREYGNTPPPEEEIYVENHEHMADEVLKRVPAMSALFPGFNKDEKLEEHAKWADAIALADPYADNHAEYTALKFLRGWTAAGMKLLLVHMQRQINKIKKAFEESVIVETAFVNAEEEAKEAERNRAELEKIRADVAREARKVRAEKLKAERALARAKKDEEKKALAEERRLRIAAMEEKEAERKRLQTAREAAEETGVRDIITAVARAQKAAKKRTISQTMAEILAKQKKKHEGYAIFDDPTNAESSEEDDAESEEEEEETPTVEELEEEIQEEIQEKESSLQELASAAAQLREAIDDAPSAEDIRAAASLNLLGAPKPQKTQKRKKKRAVKAGAEILSDLAEKASEDAAASALLGLQQSEAYSSEDAAASAVLGLQQSEAYSSEDSDEEDSDEETRAVDILFADGVTVPERLWGAMKLKNTLFFSDDERVNFIDDILEDDESVEEIERDAYVNKQLVGELEKLYEKSGRESPDILPVWREYVDSFYFSMVKPTHLRFDSSEEESEEELQEDEETWLDKKKKEWAKLRQSKKGRKLANELFALTPAQRRQRRIQIMKDQRKAGTRTSNVRTKAIKPPKPGTVPALRARLRQLNMPVNGNKAALQERLTQAENVYEIAKNVYETWAENDKRILTKKLWRKKIEEVFKERFNKELDKDISKKVRKAVMNDRRAAQSMDRPEVVAEAIPEATVWTHEHYAQHKQHFVKTMFRKAMSLVSRFAPRKMKFASKPASLQVAVAVPVASAIAKVANTKRIPRKDFNLNAGAPLLVNDIMSRG